MTPEKIKIKRNMIYEDVKKYAGHGDFILKGIS